MGRILDAGCGSGRDSKAFLNLGYQVRAFEAAPALAELASKYLNVPVDVTSFQELELDKEFNGIWACASLLHVPLAVLPDTIQNLLESLKSNGVLYASFKYGKGETERDGRQFTDMDEHSFAHLAVQLTGISSWEMWTSKDTRPNRNQESWLNALLKVE